MDLGVGMQPFGREYVADDHFDHGLADGLVGYIVVVLRREHHGIHRHRATVLVAQRYLALGIGAQPRQRAVLAQLRLTLDQAVCVGDRRWHQYAGLVAGVAEHQALIPGALFLVFRRIDALRDVARLLADRIQHGAGAAVETERGTVIADIDDDLPDQVLELHIGAGGYLAGDYRHAGLDQCLHGNTRVRVILDDRIEYGIGDLVGHLVGVTLRDRLGGEDRIFAHGNTCSLGFWKMCSCTRKPLRSAR